MGPASAVEEGTIGLQPNQGPWSNLDHRVFAYYSRCHNCLELLAVWMNAYIDACIFRQNIPYPSR